MKRDGTRQTSVRLLFTFTLAIITFACYAEERGRREKRRRREERDGRDGRDDGFAVVKTVVKVVQTRIYTKIESIINEREGCG